MELCIFNFYWSVFEEFMIWGWFGHRKQVWGPCTEGKTYYESRGSVREEIFMNQRPEKRISSAWRPEFRQKVNMFDKNATKSDFDHPPGNISAIPTHLDGSRDPVRDQKIRKKWKCPGLQSATWEGTPKLLLSSAGDSKWLQSRQCLSNMSWAWEELVSVEAWSHTLEEQCRKVIFTWIFVK